MTFELVTLAQLKTLEAQFQEAVTLKQTPLVANRKKLNSSQPPAPLGNTTFDLDLFIKEYGLPVSDPEPWQGGYRWIFSDCPWRAGDGPTAYLIQHATGAISAGCQHESCPGSRSTGNHWQDLRERYEGIKTDPFRHPSEIAPSSLDEALSTLARTEFGLADRFLARHKDHAKYIEAWGEWIVFDGTRWIRSYCAAERLAQNTILALLREAKFLKDTP